MTSRASLSLWVLTALAACSRPLSEPTPLPPRPSVLAGSPTSISPVLSPPVVREATTRLAAGQSTAFAPAVSTPEPQPDPATATPDPYAGLTIFDLASREYGGGVLRLREQLPTRPEAGFARYIFSYPSDGLTIYGFMNLPEGSGPFPVVIALHGYIDPAEYQTLDYTTRYADALAGAGYLVLHPNLRGYSPSDSGPNPFRVGMAIDVLNLIAIVEDQAGRPGPLAEAEGGRIGLWGHSMGGGISLRVLTVSDSVDAAVLYGSMSGDEARNWSSIYEWSDGRRGGWELNVPVSELIRISPIFFLDWIAAPVSVHHGSADHLVPPAWSLELCEALQQLAKPHECFSYPGQPHTFFGENDRLFMDRTTVFFDQHLREP